MCYQWPRTLRPRRKPDNHFDPQHGEVLAIFIAADPDWMNHTPAHGSLGPWVGCLAAPSYASSDGELSGRRDSGSHPGVGDFVGADSEEWVHGGLTGLPLFLAGCPRRSGKPMKANPAQNSARFLSSPQPPRSR